MKIRWWKKKTDQQCKACFGLGWCYREEYDGTSMEYCGPVCPRCNGSGIEPTDKS